MSAMRVSLFGAFSAAIALVVVLVGSGNGHTSAAVAGNRVPYGQSQWYLHGVNVAWYNWACDFGCGNNGGVSSTDSQSAIRAKFAELSKANTRTLRWWMFEGDAWQIERDANGAPLRINPVVYADIDAAVKLAEEYDLYYNFVLFGFPGDIPSSWLNDPAQRQKLADVLAPLFARYKDNPHVFAWEPFNEPEWDIWNGKVKQAPVQDTVRAIVGAVKANSNTYTTVGSAMLDGLPMWKGMGLDFYQVHWYDYMSGGDWCAMCTDYNNVRTRYGLDAPLVIGEFYTGSGTEASKRYDAFYTKGYAGAWGWSLFSERTQDRMQVDLNAAGSFAAAHPGVVGPQQATLAGTPTPKPASPSATVTTPVATTTPPPTATPAPVSEWRSSAVVSATKVNRGGSITVTASGTSPSSTSALFDVEIYSPSGKKVYQKFYDRQSFAAGVAKSYAVPWKVPANAERGTWTVKIGVFTPGWSNLLHWNNSATTFTVR